MTRVIYLTVFPGVAKETLTLVVAARRCTHSAMLTRLLSTDVVLLTVVATVAVCTLALVVARPGLCDTRTRAIVETRSSGTRVLVLASVSSCAHGTCAVKGALVSHLQTGAVVGARGARARVCV